MVPIIQYAELQGPSIKTKSHLFRKSFGWRKSGAVSAVLLLLSAPATVAQWWCHLNHYFFTALHGMQTRSSDDNSVCLSIKRVICDKMEERSVQMFILYERTFSLVFWEEEWLVGATPSAWNLGSTGPRWSEVADFQPIFHPQLLSRNT